MTRNTENDTCPLGKASCDPLDNGCDGECEVEWLSFPCSRGSHLACAGVAWQPDIACECACGCRGRVTPPGGRGHHPECYQSTGVPDDLPANLCDCRVLRIQDAVNSMIWRVRHVDSGATVYCRNRMEAEARHDYVRIGYGGAGWSLYRCTTCGDEDIDA